jgi:hypothetical protein
MKTYLRIAALVVVVAVILVAFSVFRRAAAPESEIIAGERKRVAASFDKSRVEKDPIYAFEFQDKLQFLDYRLATAYNREEKPDAAITVLQGLIADEESKNESGVRRSRSYFNEARYNEALQASYGLKHDDTGAERAGERRSELLEKA